MGETGRAPPPPASLLFLPLPVKPSALGWPRPRRCGRLWFPDAHSAAAVFEDALHPCPQTVFLLSPSLWWPLPAPALSWPACCHSGHEKPEVGGPQPTPSFWFRAHRRQPRSTLMDTSYKLSQSQLPQLSNGH